MLMSTGASQSYSGSSYSLDGGHNWTTLETGTQRLALGIVAYSFYYIINTKIDHIINSIERANLDFLDIISAPSK